MKFIHSFGASLCIAVLIVGCGKSDDTSVAPPPPAPKPPDQAAVMAAQPVVAPPAPTAPPPAGGAAAPAPAASDEPGATEVKIEGKMVSTLAYLQSFADAYTRTRAGQEDGPQKLPPLTDLQMLVSTKFITRLPAAPAGQKFVYDAQSGKVSLAPK